MRIQSNLASMAAGGYRDALDLLEQDHATVIDLLDSYHDLDSDEAKEALVSRIIFEVTVHGRIEEELFLPMLRQALGEYEVMDEGTVRHAMIRKLMADLHGAKAKEWRYDARMKALARLVKHHIKEEERQVFAEARASELNLFAIGRQLDAYKAVLQSRYELDTTGEELATFLAITTRNRQSSINRLANPAFGGSTRSCEFRRGSVSAVIQRAARRSSRVNAGAGKRSKPAANSKEN